jgi:hypothetical protein
MTNANKTIVRDKILDLKEKISKQSADLKKEIELKNRRYLEIFNSDAKEVNNPGLVVTSVFSLLMVAQALQKGYTFAQLKEVLSADEILKNKENLVEKIYTQVEERLKIIELAETNDLKDFLKENDVYSIFENGKLEKFLELGKDDLKSKNHEKKKENIMEESHER